MKFVNYCLYQKHFQEKKNPYQAYNNKKREISIDPGVFESRFE